MVEICAPDTVERLAQLSADCTTLYFGIGLREGSELLRCVEASLIRGESLVIIDTSAGCLAQIEGPEQLPAIGAWCSKGALIDYAFDQNGVAELMECSRRFAM